MKNFFRTNPAISENGKKITVFSVAWINPEKTPADISMDAEEETNISAAYLFAVSDPGFDENWMPAILTEEEEEKILYNEYY